MSGRGMKTRTCSATPVVAKPVICSPPKVILSMCGVSRVTRCTSTVRGGGRLNGTDGLLVGFEDVM